MKKCYKSEVEANGTVWTVDASTNDGRVKAEVMAASEIKKGLPNAYRAWTDAEHDVLLERWDAGDTVDAIAQQLGRGRGGVRSRLVKLGRIEGADRAN